MNKSKLAIVLFTTVLLAACEGMPKNFADLKESLKGRNPDDDKSSYGDGQPVVTRKPVLAKSYDSASTTHSNNATNAVTGKNQQEVLPEKGSVHELYPFQLTGWPNNMVEEIQIKGRGEFSGEIYSCASSKRTIYKIFGKLVVMQNLDRPKDWPSFGYTSEVQRLEMADGSSTYKVSMYISSRHPTEMRRYGKGVYDYVSLEWNDEVMPSGAMEGKRRLHGVYIGSNFHQLPEGEIVSNVYCTHISDPEKVKSNKEYFAAWTMTPDQLLEYSRLNPELHKRKLD